MSDTLLEMADSFSDDWTHNLTEPPSDPVEADNPTEFTAAAWNKYGGEYDASEIRELTSYVSDNWEGLDSSGLEKYLNGFEDSEKEPGYKKSIDYGF